MSMLNYLVPGGWFYYSPDCKVVKITAIDDRYIHTIDDKGRQQMISKVHANVFYPAEEDDI